MGDLGANSLQPGPPNPLKGELIMRIAGICGPLYTYSSVSVMLHFFKLNIRSTTHILHKAWTGAIAIAGLIRKNTHK